MITSASTDPEVMAGDEYASTGGGSLKLKGIKGSKVDKHRKKKKSKAVDASDPVPTDSVQPVRNKLDEAEQKPSSGRVGDAEAGADTETPLGTKSESNTETLAPVTSHKTAAELRHEERRKKLLDERLRRNGVKTHKERVEELNKYLSGLSEHNDMPKIGPG